MSGVATGIHVAVVEDDQFVRRALTRLLVATGFVVRAFDSSEQLLSTLGQDDSDCLLVDVHLPRLSGLELHRLLQRRTWTVPVIFVTADPDVAHSPEMALTGAFCFVKPFDEKELVDAIRLLATPRS